jgi:hypothetical protein
MRSVALLEIVKYFLQVKSKDKCIIKKENLATRVAICVGMLLVKITAKCIMRDEQKQRN